MSEVQTGTVTTTVPARLDRLPWSRWHWMIVIGLGTVWILDGLLFSRLVGTGKVSDTVVAFSVGAALMILAGITEIFFGVAAERQSLESIARPLTADDAGAVPSGTAPALT